MGVPLTVTFDTNTLASVVSPETAQRGTRESGGAVRAAIIAGRVQGFFSATLVTIEGIVGADRVAVLGSTRVTTCTASPDDRTVNISIGLTQDRKPPDQRASERVNAALALGMRALRPPARMVVGFRVRDDDNSFYKTHGSIEELTECMNRVNKMATGIEARGVGRAAALGLGREFSLRDNAPEPELWLQGLGRAHDRAEGKKVATAVREWADGDSVAAHYGFGISLFCTEDQGSNSVLSPTNRQWLSSEFGVRFVTLAGLSAIVAR